MPEAKTKKTNASVKEFIDRIPDEARRKDCRVLVKIMREASGATPRMWGTSIVGFGSYRYKYASGREGDWPLIGFSPRKQDLTLYIMCSMDAQPKLMADLGKHKRSKGCLYLKRLEDVDTAVLRKLVEASVKHMKRAAE